MSEQGRSGRGRWAVGRVGAGDTAPEGYFEEVAAIKVDEDAALWRVTADRTNPARTVDICPLATEDLSDGAGRMPRKPNPAMEEELKGQKVYRDPSFRSRTFLPLLAEKPWEAGILGTTDKLVEGVPLFGVIQKRQIRAVWDWRRANLRWQRPMHGPPGSSATLTNLDLSNLGEAEMVYTGVGAIPDRFDRFETPPDVWLYFVLEGLPIHEFFDYMRTTGQGYVIPHGGSLLAVKVLVMGRPWLLPLAHSRPKALTARRLWAGSGGARLVYGAPTHQLIGPVEFESGSWAYMDDYGVVATYASGRQPVSEVMRPTLHCLGRNRSHLWPGSGGAGAGGADVLDPGAIVKLRAWAAISQRMGLAICDRVYREMRRPETAKTPFRLTDAARWGLTTMAYCAPPRHTDLEAPWFSQVSMTGMTDSKDKGHGVAVTATDAWAPHVGGCTYDVGELAEASATPPQRISWRVHQALHLFAGRRREGDLEEAIYARAECDGYEIKVWPIDSVIEPKHDRPNDELVSAILGQTRDGHFHAVIASPPCSTWSRACFLKERPRPSRTRLEPWGRSDILLTTFEHIRLDLGSRLLLTAMQAVREVCRTGGLGLTDHPADPEEDLYTSIGTPPEMACLCEETGGQIYQIDQGRYGASPRESTMKGIFGVYDDALDLAVGRLRPRGNHRGRHQAILEGRVERGRPDICTASAQACQPPRRAARGGAILEALARMAKEMRGPDPACSRASPATTSFGPPRPGGAEIEVPPPLSPAWMPPARWRPLYVGRWRSTEHTNTNEMRTVVGALRLLARSPRRRMLKVLSFTKSMVAQGAPGEGHSSSSALLRLGHGHYRYVPPELNVAEGDVPLQRRGPRAWDNYEKETYLGIREGGSTRRFTHSVADVIAAQWAPKVRDILSYRVDKGWELRCKSVMGHALADYRDMKCYRDRLHPTWGSIVLSGWLGSWPELRSQLPLALRSLKSCQRLVVPVEGGPWPEEAVFAIAVYFLEGGLLGEAIGTLMQYDVYGQEQATRARRAYLDAETLRAGGARANYSKQQRRLVDSNKTNLNLKKVKEVATELATTGRFAALLHVPLTETELS
ncbi:unnamed protein product [Prorocentrum cordatum]|uniref:Uncharacterized protein n=1 Tax=Prorocentrum cordatum TaxID=2364126 RepID=A0ABN9R4R4_9DINO|nr:unnamed protein product [Polarella glacialis]